MRVQIPAYTDRWMMGDRYGDVVKVSHRKATFNEMRFINRGRDMLEIAHVKLDISGKTMRFLLADCTEV